MICAQLFGRMCTNELPRWTSVDELLGTILNNSAPPELAAGRLRMRDHSQMHGSVTTYRARAVIKCGILAN